MSDFDTHHYITCAETSIKVHTALEHTNDTIERLISRIQTIRPKEGYLDSIELDLHRLQETNTIIAAEILEYLRNNS